MECKHTACSFNRLRRLHIIDSRFKPDINNSLDRKIERFHYSDYANEQEFAKIYYLFSRESVKENSIQKRAEELPKPKGKGVQRGVFKGGFQSIDEAFLEELDEIRSVLAKSFKRKNPELNSEELTEATQRTIDRLVFIRFLEDKLIEPEHYVNVFGNSNSPWKDFVNVSRRMDAKYNGVVFKKHSVIDSNDFKGADDNDFRKICNDLSHINSPYDFNYIPIHILGSIYERFLGKVIHATAKQVKIEEKPEVRKAGGVYYTPQYIVKYIVDNTVGKIIEGKTPNEISKLKFADISCGSGSFLITVYDTILHYVGKWYNENPEYAKKDGAIDNGGEWILSFKQKRKILIDNIFGVDIDYQAVEVTQLSLFLKLLEDETTATANEMMVLFKEKILPDLANNIICGNSLIGTDMYESSMFPSGDERRINAMNFEDRFTEIIKNGGFDAIVGNPPYGANTIFKEDTYITFIKRSKEILRTDGLISYIIPTSWLSGVRYKNFRNFILSNYQIEKIISLPFNIFKDCYVDTCVFIFSKRYKIIYDLKVFSYGKKEQINELVKDENFSKYSVQNIISDENNSISTNSDVYAIKNKFNNERFDLLGNISFSTIGILASKYNITETPQRNSQKYFVGNINRYKYTIEKISFIDLSKHSDDYLKYYFDSPKIWIRRIINRQDRIMCTIPEENLVVKKDIYSFSITNKLKEQYMLGLLNSRLLSYIYLNMSAISTKDDFRQTTLKELRQLPIKKINLDFADDKSKYIKIVNLVDQMLESKKQLSNSKTENEKTYWEQKCNSIDNQIDRLVNELYGLTEEEIRKVEGKD